MSKEPKTSFFPVAPDPEGAEVEQPATFEEQFPSWNKFMVDIKFKKLDKIIKDELRYYKLRCEYQLQAMEKCCLDKQRVKEAINNRNILLFATKFENERLALEIANAFKVIVERKLKLNEQK